jgi:AcrR family transcriptional regulator
LNDELKAKQRERLLNAASTVFARSGFLGTKVTDIAAAAGVSHGLVHHYFRSKAEVFVAIIERAMTNAAQLPAVLAAIPGTYRQRLEWFVGQVFQGVKEMPEVFFLSVEATANAAAPAEARRLVAEQGLKSMEGLARFIAEGQSAGEFKAGAPTLLAMHLLALVQGLALQRLGVADFPFDPSVEIAMGLLLPTNEASVPTNEASVPTNEASAVEKEIP